MGFDMNAIITQLNVDSLTYLHWPYC